jgi:hypothetical protein
MNTLTSSVAEQYDFYAVPGKYFDAAPASAYYMACQLFKKLPAPPQQCGFLRLSATQYCCQIPVSEDQLCDLLYG